MIEPYFRPRNKISSVFFLCIATIIVWFILFPPEIQQSNKLTNSLSIQDLELVLQEILHMQSYAADVFVSALNTEEDAIGNYSLLLSLMKQQTKNHRLFHYNDRSLLISLDDEWELFEEDHITYIKSDTLWEHFDYIQSSINPLKHLYNISLYNVDIIADDNIYYFIPIPHQESSYEVLYVIQINQQATYIDEFSILIYNKWSSELEIIRYLFEQWNDKTNRDIIETTKENIRQVIVN